MKDTQEPPFSAPPPRPDRVRGARGSLETVGFRVNAGAGESAEERVGASPGVGGPASEPFSDRTDDFDCPVRQDLLGGQMKRYHSVQQEPLIESL